MSLPAAPPLGVAGVGLASRNFGFAKRRVYSPIPLEVLVKKRLTFSFLPWAAAAGVCVGGFARGADEVPAAPTPADASVLSAADAAPAAEAAAVADEAVAGGAGT